MTDGQDHLSEFTLHIVLATFPQNQEQDFNISVRQEFFKKYRDTCDDYLTNKDENYWLYNENKETPVLYNPLCYHILGNYDVAYITLVDSFKFAQRLFEPRANEKHDIKLFAPHTFQSFTGITHHRALELKRFFYDHLKPTNPTRKFFLGICNLKLNNGFLIGSGKKYLNAVMEAIDKMVKKHSSVEYLKLQSFSWFEISLLIFADDLQQIADIIQSLRRLTMHDLLRSNPDILKDSLYQAYYKDEKQEYFENANVFADTHTYMGIHTDVFNLESDYGAQLEAKNYKLKTELEWQIKPGHLHLLAKMLHEEKILKKYPIGRNDKFFIAGRSDYCLKANLTSLNDVLRLIRLIVNRQTKLFDHVRKIKTNVYFKGLRETKHTKKAIISLSEMLTPLAEDMDVVAKVNEQLKALKISRQIRSKVVKIFSNYNNGIQDIVLFPYLLDFKIFIERLKDAIDESYTRFIGRFKYPSSYSAPQEVDRLEDILMKMIEIFQEGFNIRMLNPYQFEDINDFDLDFNSSIQQLLSVYSSLAFEIGNLVYTKPYTYGPVIQLNLKDTVSTHSSINYSVNHLTSPEFVFATITKEIINALPKDDDVLNKILKDYKKQKSELLKRNPIIKDLENRGLINLSYFLNDAFRYVWTYKMEFKLFYYWFWTYNFQNASLYSEMGLMDESHFEKELFRIMFIANFYDKDHTNEVKCPLPELETYWERHFQKIKLAVSDFVEFLDEKDIIVRFLKNMEECFDRVMEVGELECPISGEDDEGSELLSEIESKYHELNMWSDYTVRLAHRCYVFKHRNVAPAELIENKNSVLYIEWYMWDYLNKIYDINEGKISLVRRNWKTGTPMISFIEDNESAHLYSVDQTGGLFFESLEQQNAYFKQTTSALLDLWDFALVRKKKFIMSFLPKK